MAEKKTGITPIQDRTLWYSDLAFMPSEDKNSLWMAQFLFYAKQAGVPFLSTKRKREYRRLERGEIDQQDYINLIDPPTPMGGGGRAQYFAADWKTCPIDQHLDNIVRAKLDKIGIVNQIQVNEIDKFSKGQRIKAKYKILYQNAFREILNEILVEIGFPPISDSESPYAYVQSLSSEKGDEMVDTIGNIVDYIRNQLKDSQDLSLFDSYIYKGDVERAFEMGISHYLINLNKWHVKCQSFNNDLKNFNRACGTWTIDETTGRGMVEYLEPDQLFTSSFNEKNGEDIQFWFYEKDITFAEFVRQFGTTLSDEELKEVFEINKVQGAAHGMEWKGAKGVKGSNAKIRIGKLSCLTQDADKFSESYVNNRIPVWERKPLSWLPHKNTPNKYKTEQRQKIYNVWYSCYYVPPPGERLSRNAPTDWAWQSRYIFNIKKDIDMYRYGVDMRYAKSSLVIWKDDRMSFTDIKEAYMPKIRTLWHKFQNCIVQDTTSMVIDWDFISGLLNAVDEKNKVDPGNPDKPTGGNGIDAGMEQWKAMRQGGIAFMKFRDKNGNVVVQDPSKFFVLVDTKHLDKAERFLKLILEQYNLLTLSLAQNDITEGADPKPRTAVAGIQASIAATRDGLWFIEMPAREFLVMFGERCVQFLINITKERKQLNFKQRWSEFESVVGVANSMLLESVEDLQPEEIGLTVTLEDTQAKKQYYTELTTQMLRDGEISFEDVEMIIDTIQENYKYGAVLLSLAAKRRAREKADMEAVQHERAKELQQMQLQTAMMLNQAKGQAKDQNITTQAQADQMLQDQMAKLKTQSMSILSNQRKENKMSENKQKAELEDAKEQRKELTPITE